MIAKYILRPTCLGMGMLHAVQWELVKQNITIKLWDTQTGAELRTFPIWFLRSCQVMPIWSTNKALKYQLKRRKLR
jgi:hypothetical protein